MTTSKPMTIGQLAKRTRVSIRVLREYDRLGLIYTLGRSESNYRLYDDTALWCVRVIGVLRSLGLTLKDIQELTDIYCDQRSEPFGPHLAGKLDNVLNRVEERLSDLQALRKRILDFKATHHSALSGQDDLSLYASDPCRRPASTVRPLDSTPGVRVYAGPDQLSARRAQNE